MGRLEMHQKYSGGTAVSSRDFFFSLVVPDSAVTATLIFRYANCKGFDLELASVIEAAPWAAEATGPSQTLPPPHHPSWPRLLKASYITALSASCGAPCRCPVARYQATSSNAAVWPSWAASRKWWNAAVCGPKK